MNKRNWSDLSRKLVDRYDMKYTSDNYQNILGQYANGFWGVGVLPTTFYPNPFPIALSLSVLGGSVGNGIGFDENGLLTRIDASSTTSKNFLVSAALPADTRYDLLCIRYKETGSTPVPKPSDPILTVDLNLVDDFELVVRAGTSSGYPIKQSGDIILAGLQVPAAATLGTQITIDLGIRELCRVNFSEQAQFIQEIPVGVIDGANKIFTLSATPYDSNSLMVMINNRVILKTEYSRIENVITLVVAPALAQSISVFYVAISPTSINPLSGFQEVPLGVIDGVNDTFTLTGKPADLNSCLVFLDRFLLVTSEYSLIQATPNYQIKFKPGSIPAAGQDVYIFYFINPASVGVGSMGGGGGGGAGLIPVGSPGAPQIINPAAGVGITINQRQAIWVRSSGGAEVVTANPQIQAGTTVGQELVLIGTSDINYSELNDGNGLSLNGPIDLKQNITMWLVWDGTTWNEISRR